MVNIKKKLKIKFPSCAGLLPKNSMLARYYKVYYGFFKNLFTHSNADIEFIGDTAVADGAFYVEVNGKKVIFDYSDHLRNDSFRFKNDRILLDNIPILKSHFVSGIHDTQDYEGYYPFSPISFYDWDSYYVLSNRIVYNPSSNIINRQIAYGNANKRRKKVVGLLRDNLSTRAKTSQVDQNVFWNEINDCLAGVFVPGCRPDMLDRGHLQYMAFGACTISPEITNTLPYYRSIEPNKHYLACNYDYNNLIDVIEYSGCNKTECKTIGNNAKNLFTETCTPDKLIKWVQYCIEDYYE